jgi:hypothetical protein
MLAATKIPTRRDRTAALSQIPWQAEGRALAGLLAGTLRQQAVELIDIAVGTPHARAALVALQEAADALTQGAIELVESLLAEQQFAEGDVVDPLGDGGVLTQKMGLERMRHRLVRAPVEDAAIRLSAAGNHLVNAHLRFAWEANAAAEADVRRCGFDPDSEQRLEWASLEGFARGLRKCGQDQLSVLPHFALTEPFRVYAANAAVKETRDFRDQIVHRDRPSYREAASFGRRSVWRGAPFKIEFPRETETDPDAPSIAERRDVVIRAGGATLAYIEATWDLMQSWFRTVGVFIAHEGGQVTVRTEMQPGQTGPRLPRAQRDPGQFLSTSAA